MMLCSSPRALSEIENEMKSRLTRYVQLIDSQFDKDNLLTQFNDITAHYDEFLGSEAKFCYCLIRAFEMMQKVIGEQFKKEYSLEDEPALLKKIQEMAQDAYSPGFFDAKTANKRAQFYVEVENNKQKIEQIKDSIYQRHLSGDQEASYSLS